MLERIGILRTKHQPGSNGLPEAVVEVILRCLANCCQQSELRTGADAGELTERRQSFGRQAIELDDHEIDHVVGVVFGVDATDVKKPSRICVIVDQQCFIRERREKLNSEKWIAAGLLVQQLHERAPGLGLAAQRVCDQLSEVAVGQGRQKDVLHCRARPADRIELAHQRVRSIDLVVSIGAD